jgi:hypothetical protein
MACERASAGVFFLPPSFSSLILENRDGHCKKKKEEEKKVCLFVY